MNPEACCSSSCCYSSLQRTVRNYPSLHSIDNIVFFRKTHQSSLTLNEGFFLKSPRPSLPLKRAPPLSPSPFPLRGQGMYQPPYSVLKPLRYKVGGPSEVFASSRAAVCGMRPHGHESLRGCRLNSFNFWTYETWVNYLCSFAKFINAIQPS